METLIVLIPKVSNSDTLHKLRPISLCNVSYELITKIITIRLRSMISHLFPPNQLSFAPGIQDNIIIAQELIHVMRRTKHRQGFMIIKVDLEKACDRLDWGFISETLLLACIPANLRGIILDCIMSFSMQVLWNGSLRNSFGWDVASVKGVPYLCIFLYCI